MSRVSIAVDIREVQQGFRNGIARYVLNFLRCARQAKPEWEFVLMGNQYTAKDAVKGYRTETIFEWSTLYWDQSRLPLFLKKEHIDLFFSPYPKAPVFCPCKKVVTIHDVTPFLHSFPREKENAVKASAKKLLACSTAKSCDAIVTVSEHSRQDIIRLFGIDGRKIRVVYNAAADSFSPVRDEAALRLVREKYAIERNYILNVGNFLPHKNVEGLIKAYAMLSAELRRAYQLVIVARKDRNFSGISALCKESKIEDRVVFIDFADDNDLARLYSSASIFVCPSFYEGFGLPVLEAMACGAPVLASRAASLPEVAGDGARLFDPRDCREVSFTMAEVLASTALREELARRGLERARNFSLEKTASGIINCLESVCR
jgi:glycosyltransferase involved in cell wall biosynthesis